MTIPPILYSIKNLEVQKEYTICEIRYYVPADVVGCELMGVDENLSWVPNQSIEMKKISKVDDDWNIYGATLKIERGCEFRGRAFDDEGDRWEIGDNHKLVRLEDGGLNLITLEEVKKTVDFHPYPPIEWVPDVKIAELRIRKDKKARNFTQYLVDSIVYSVEWLNRPEVLFLHLPQMMRNIRKGLRKLDSYMADEIVRPLLKIFFEILMEIRITDETQEARVLLGFFEKNKYEERMLEILDKIANCPIFNRELEMSEEQRIEDSILRLKSLFTLI